MVSCTFDVTSILESKSRIEDMNSDVMLFHVPFTAAAVEKNHNLMDDVMSGFLQRIYHVFEDFQLDEYDIKDMKMFCNLLISFKQSGKCDNLIAEVDGLLSRLPDVVTLESEVENIYKIAAFSHIWLILRITQLIIAFRNLPGSITVFYNIVDILMEDFLNQEYSRIISRSIGSEGPCNTLLKSKDDFKSPRKLGWCSCIPTCWRYVIDTISQASLEHLVPNKTFWDVFNSSFNNVSGLNQVMNISALVWIFEQVSALAMETNPDLPSNWSPLQELVKQSCSRPSHLAQTLTTLIKMNGIWQPQIIITMTLQQEFFRQLSRSDGKTIVLELDPKQYTAVIDSILAPDVAEVESTFEKFLQFYVNSLLRIPEAKRLNLIKRILNMERQTLCNMSLQSFQNYGLWIGVCINLTDPGSLSAQLCRIFATHSSDLISTCRFPGALISFQAALILLHAKLGIEYDLLADHIAIMIAKLSEDYIRSENQKKNILFGYISKSFDNILLLLKENIKLTPTTFFGPWIGILMEEGHEQRLVRMLQIVHRILLSSAPYCNETDIKLTNQLVVKPILKFLQIKSDKDKVLLETIAIVLTEFSVLVLRFPRFRDTFYQQIILNHISKQPFHSLYLSFNFTHAIILHEKSAELVKDNETKLCNIVFIALSQYYVLHDPSTITSEPQDKKLLQLLPFLVSAVPFDMGIHISEEGFPNFPLSFITKLNSLFLSLSFSDTQVLKEFVWKIVSGLSSTLLTMLLGKLSELSLNKLFSYLATIFETIPNLLFSSSKDNSPLIELFNTFFTPRLSSLPTDVRKSRTAILPNVFSGLSSISYKSNNLFFKDIMKVFDDVYPQVSASDWKANRETPFLTRMFSFSFENSLTKSSLSFRKSFMLYLKSSRYLDSDNLSKTAIFVFFLLKLETRTTNLELLLFDFHTLYPFLLQVLLKSSLSKHHDSELKSNVTSLLRYLILKLNKELDNNVADTNNDLNCNETITQTQEFIISNAHLGCDHIIGILSSLVCMGGHHIAAQNLECLENHLNGRHIPEYEKLQNEILNRMK